MNHPMVDLLQSMWMGNNALQYPIRKDFSVALLHFSIFPYVLAKSLSMSARMLQYTYINQLGLHRGFLGKHA